MAKTVRKWRTYSDAGLSVLVSVYRQRIEELSVGPVREDWDGVFEATRK